MHLTPFLSAALSLSIGLVAVTSVAAEHQSSHEIVRRADGTYEARELITIEERQRREEAELRKRQSVGVGGAGVGIAGADAGIGNVTLKIGNIKVTTGDLLLENIHIGNITVLVNAGVGKRDNVPDQAQIALPGLPSFAPGQIPPGPVKAVIVAGDETVIYSPPPSEPTGTPATRDDDQKVDHHHTATKASSISAPTEGTTTTVHGDVAMAVVTAVPTVLHDHWKRQNASVGPVSASIGPIGVGVGNVNVTVGDVNVKLGGITVKNVTIGNILVNIKINANQALQTIVGLIPTLVSDVSGAVGGAGAAATGGSSSSSSNAEDDARRTHAAKGSGVTQFVKEKRQVV